MTLEEIYNLKPEAVIPDIGNNKFFIPFEAVKIIKCNVSKRAQTLIKNLKSKQFENNRQVLSLQENLNLILVTVNRIQPHLNLLLLYSQMSSMPNILLITNKEKYNVQQKEEREKIEDIYEDVFNVVDTCKMLLKQIKLCEKSYIDIRHSLILM